MDLHEQIIKPIAFIQTDFKEKFGIPRQSMLVQGALGRIVMEKNYNEPAAFRGIEEYTHLWILWGFSKSPYDGKTMTVHPPRLGGKRKKGVFACRSPFRPNGIGMSAVKLEQVIEDPEEGISLLVSGVDMLDGTPIYDIKPYVPYSDSYPDASGGFGQAHHNDRIDVEISDELLAMLPEGQRQTVIDLLSQDPRDAYNKAPGYVYGMRYGDYDIRFLAEQDLITVKEIVCINDAKYGKVK